MRYDVRNPRHALLFLWLFLTLVVGLACRGEPTAVLSVSITQQPVGGSGVNTVRCTFTGTATDTASKSGKLNPVIDVRTVWKSSHSSYNEESYRWIEDGEVLTYTISKSAPEGYYLDKPFWAELTWDDANGSHKLVSDTAHCE